VRILVLVLAARPWPYPILIRTIERTWASVDVDGISTLSYFGGNRLEESGRRLYLPVTDALPAGRKTIACFEHVLANHDFELVFRTNASSYVDLPNLHAFAAEHARSSGFYCGRRAMYGELPFASGAGFFLSKDLVRLAVERQHELDHSLPDDISLALLLHGAGVEVVDAPRVTYESARDVDEIDTSQFLFRCKTGSPWRIGDIRLMLTLHQAFVRLRGGRYRSPLLWLTTALGKVYAAWLRVRSRTLRSGP
jgi:hypothetical protein